MFFGTKFYFGPVFNSCCNLIRPAGKPFQNRVVFQSSGYPAISHGFSENLNQTGPSFASQLNQFNSVLTTTNSPTIFNTYACKKTI